METLPGREIKEWKLLRGGNPILFENLKSLNLSEPPFITKKADRRIKPN